MFIYVLVIVVYDRETRRSRNFGYVSFMDERDAEDAMKQMGGDGGKGKVNFLEIISHLKQNFIL